MTDIPNHSNSARINRLREMVDKYPDNALFHYTLGAEYLKMGDAHSAILPLQESIRIAGDYSAAYRELGKALSLCGKTGEAQKTFEEGILIGEKSGDLQTVREMKVFLKRLKND